MTLADWMQANGKNASEVAEGSGVTAPSLSRFFSGQTSLSPKNMSRIVRYTGGAVSYDDLIREAARARRRREARTEARP